MADEGNRDTGSRLVEGLGISIVPGTDFILSHEALSQLPTIDNVPGMSSRKINENGYESDKLHGKLGRFPQGSHVLYWKGQLGGQSSDAEKLRNAFSIYCGSSNIDVFEV